MCLQYREKEKQRKKKARAPMQPTRDDAELREVFPEVLQIPLKGINVQRPREHAGSPTSVDTPKGVCCLFIPRVIQSSFTTIG